MVDAGAPPAETKTLVDATAEVDDSDVAAEQASPGTAARAKAREPPRARPWRPPRARAWKRRRHRGDRRGGADRGERDRRAHRPGSVRATRSPARSAARRPRSRGRPAVRDAVGRAGRCLRHASRRRSQDATCVPPEDRGDLGARPARTPTWPSMPSSAPFGSTPPTRRSARRSNGSVARTIGGIGSWPSISAASTSSPRSKRRSRFTTKSPGCARAWVRSTGSRRSISTSSASRPDDAVALKRVEEIYRDQQRWEDLANVLEKRTTGPSDAITPAERRARMRELATLYEQHLERPYEAIDTLERLLMEAEQERRHRGRRSRRARGIGRRSRRLDAALLAGGLVGEGGGEPRQAGGARRRPTAGARPAPGNRRRLREGADSRRKGHRGVRVHSCSKCPTTGKRWPPSIA